MCASLILIKITRMYVRNVLMEARWLVYGLQFKYLSKNGFLEKISS